MEDRKKRRIYIFCVAVFVLGIALFFGNVVRSFTGLGATLSEFAFPGKHSLRLSEEGVYSIYHQYENPSGGESSGAVSPGDDSIVVLLTKVPEKQVIDLRIPNSRKRYSYMGKRGVKIFEFENPAPADYVIESFSRSAEGQSSYTLAVERGFEMGRLKGILLSQALLLVPTLFAIILFMRTYIRG